MGKTESAVNEQDSCRASMIIRLNNGKLIREISDCEVSYHDRNIIAGIRYGMLGMRCGEIRELTIPPHLAYGKHGVPDQVPPDSVLKIKIKVNQIIDHQPTQAAQH
ncbi:FKBP-type peptidyl-prolyl cis-trans isomerase [uncultured Gimesia sp.]|uniref:FKBP-type peptidyl-prolyl cis-trans isomerase n=1 Tax=uncultured Gimesia sp. TaxID=1678688 RepID=UPI00345140B0